MTHEEASLQTKSALSASLKKFMAKKPLKKITVSEIIADCNVNRKTFYYHFEDIYALLKWTLEQEAIEIVKAFDFLNDYEEVLNFTIRYVQANAHILNCAYDSNGRDELKRFFYQDFTSIVRRIIMDCEEQNEIHIDDGFRDFVCDFFTEAIAGMLVNMFKTKREIDNESLSQYARAFICALPTILKVGVSGEII